MSRIRVPAIAAALAVLWLGSLVPSAAAGEFRTGRDVIIPTGQTVQGDLYAAGTTVTVDGNVTGDVNAAGGTLILRGQVSGSVNAAGGTVEISGPVGGAIRAAGGTVRVSSSVGRDLVVAAGSVMLEPSATVAGDLAGGVGTLQLAGTVNGRVLAGASDMQVSGTVKGSLQVNAQRLTVASGANIGGDLDYTSYKQASIDPGARIAGKVTQHQPPSESTSAFPASPLLSLLALFLTLLLLGWGMLLLRPHTVTGPGQDLRTRPLLALGAGLAAWIGQFLVVFALFLLGALVAAVAGPIGGAFFLPAVVVLLLIGILTLVSQVPVAMAIGSFAWRRGDPSPYLAYAAGAAIWAVVIFLVGLLNGGLGFLVYLAAWITALGAITLYALRTRRDTVPVSSGFTVGGRAQAPPPTPPPPAAGS